MTVGCFVRKIDQLGRIVVPKEMRTAMGVTYGDPVEIGFDGKTVYLKKYAEHCVCCGGGSDLREFSGQRFCKKCLAKLKKLD